MITKFLSSAALVAATFLATAPSTPAQVPCHVGDDGLAVGCCKEAKPKLPDFPEVKEKGVYACIGKCKLEKAFKVEVKLGKPQWFTCDQAVFELTVSPQTPGGPSISSKIIGKYSRTWYSLTHGRQVWRFLLNGDWHFGPSIGVQGCPTPPAPNPSHVIGSVDYACDPTGADPGAAIALNLSHLPGCISHGSLSARPLPAAQAHPDRSYHLVAPSNFTFGSVNDIAGSFKEEAVRSSPSGNCYPWSARCLGEAAVIEGELATDFKNCLCIDDIDGGPWVHQKMKGEVDCSGASSVFSTVDGFDPNIPTGLAALRLGRWSGNTFPGNLELSVYVGYLQYFDPCVPFADLSPHRVCGVGTSGHEGLLFGPTPVIQPYK
ncbi:MAG: hypothetical protein ACF8XB_14550, partial [Planctomycetota bacterium JB042]